MAMLAALCLAAGAILFVQTESRLSANNNRVQAMGAMQSYDETYTLKDGDGKTKKDIWSNEVLSANNVNKKILVILGEDWCLDGSGGLNSPLAILANYDITLDLNGKILSRNLSTSIADGNVISVLTGSTFTLNDSVGTGKVTGGKNGVPNPSSSSAEKHGGGIAVWGKFVMNGGNVTGNQSTFGGGNLLVAYTGEAIMNGGKLTSGQANVNSSITWGGGGAMVYGKFTMNGGEISGNTAGYYGGGILLFKQNNVCPATFIMNGGTISGNTGIGGGINCGSALYGNDNCKITIKDRKSTRLNSSHMA